MAPLPEPRSPTVEAIYATYEGKPRDQERTYLGMSSIGEECERRLWYGFRWAHAPETYTGRKLRLFDTGHREEARLIEDLRAVGVEVFEEDPETGRQWGVIAADGHAKGHLDGVVLGLPEAPKTAHVFEAKTHSAKSFRALAKDGVAKSKPVHYAQMQAYMHLMGLTRALYLAVCKDTDEIHGERIEYDASLGLRIVAKAERVVRTDRAPAKLFDDPTSKAAFPCTYCPARGVCHEGAFARNHCRTCLHASPTCGGGWNCARWDCALTEAEQRQGCPAHLFLPDLVPGEQLDASADEEWVEYRLRDGQLWRDGAGREVAA